MTTTASTSGSLVLLRRLLLLAVVVGLLTMHAVAAAPTGSASGRTLHAAAPHSAHSTAHQVHDRGPEGQHAPPAPDGPSHHDGGPTACDLMPGGAASGVAPLVTAMAGVVALPLAAAPVLLRDATGLPPTTGPPGHASSCVLRT